MRGRKRKSRNAATEETHPIHIATQRTSTSPDLQNTLVSQQAQAIQAMSVLTPVAVLLGQMSACSSSTTEKYVSAQHDFMRFCANEADFQAHQYQVHISRAIKFLTLGLNKPKFSVYNTAAKGWVTTVNASKKQRTGESEYCGFSMLNQMKCALMALQKLQIAKGQNNNQLLTEGASGVLLSSFMKSSKAATSSRIHKMC